MKKSAQIQVEIDKLEAQRQTALLEESKIQIWNDSLHSFNSRDIGCFDIGKLEQILFHMAKGEVVLLEHCSLGNWVFSMNPQCNGVYCAPFGRKRKPFSVNINDQEPIRWDNCFHIMLAGSGNWYVLDGELAKSARELI